MPEEEVIITRFEADITDLEGGIRKAAGLMDDYDEAAKGAQKSTSDLSAKSGNLAQKVLTTVEAEKRAIKTTQELNNAQKAASSTSRQLAVDQTRVADAVKQTSASGARLNIFQKAIGGIRSGLSGAAQGARNLGSAFSDAARNILPFGNAIGAATVAAGAAVFGVIRLTKELSTLAGQVQSQDRKAAIVFGDALDDVTAAAERNANQMGLTTREYINAAAGVQDLLVPLGFAREEAAKLSTNVTDLAGALSLWSGGQVDAAEAADRLQKGLLGETESLKALGIVIDQSSKGFNDRIANLQKEQGLTREQARALDILRQVQQQTADAQANYNEGAENLIQIQAKANAELRQAKEDLAVGLTPAFIAATKAQANFITGITDLVDTSKTLQERILSIAGTGTGIPLLGTVLRAVARAGGAAAFGNDLASRSIGELEQRLKSLTSLRDKLIAQGDGDGAAFQQREIDQVKAAIVNHKDYTEVIEKEIDVVDNAAKSITVLKDELKALQDEQAKSTTREQFLEIQKLIEAKEAEIKAITGDNTPNERAVKDANRREAERLKLIEQRIEAEQNVADILREVADLEKRRSLSERDQEKFDVDQDVERQIRLIEEQIAVQEKSARATISNSRELATELERIEADKQNAIFIITQDGNARRLAIDQKFNLQEVAAAEDARDSIIDYLRTDLERQEAEIEQNYRDQLELAEKFITDEDELAQIRIALKRKRDQELTDLTNAATEELRKAEEERISEYAEITEQFFTDGTASLVAALSGQTSAINAQYQQQLADLATFNGSEEELQLERERILAERNAAILEQQSSFSKELIILLLDALEKVVQIAAAEALVSTIADGATKGGLAGALAGAATGAIIQGLIKGIFATVKGAVAGAYYGEEYVSGKEVFPGEKDSYIRRVHKGERIVTAEKNQRYRAPLHAIHEGKFEQFIETNYVLPRISAYLQSDTGKRTTDSVMLAKYYDANIVGALHKSMKLQQETNAILARSISARSGRYW